MKKKFQFFISLLVICLLSVVVTYGQISATQIPLNPKAVPQFVDPLPHFAGIRVDASGGNLTINYEPLTQVAVSTGTVLKTGTVGQLTPAVGLANFWGYSVSNGTINAPAYWPAFTIEAKRGTPVNVTYNNNLGLQTYANVNLIADQTLHWANPLNAPHTTMTPYEGEIPVSPHLHGGEVPSESDGGPDSWFTPSGLTGPSWGIDGTDNLYRYPNTQEGATLWWHDHALGVTRLNVYAGLAGFYFLRDLTEDALHLPGWSGDDLVQEVAPPGTSGVFNPAPYLPEIEVVFQDRMFDDQGGLYYPNLPPNPAEHPFWTPEFVGDIITVNGKTWPYLSVAQRKYRFRLLNGSNARFYEMNLQDLATGALGPQIVQIGTDGGFLDAPVPIAGKLLLAPGERADVIIDFSTSAPGQVWTLKNSANTPFPKGGPPNGSTVGRLMQFVVNGTMVSPAGPAVTGIDKSQVAASLRATNVVNIKNAVPDLKRQLTLNEVMGMGGPLEVLVNNTKWMGPVTEQPVEGTTELWQIINLTADAHPIHLHLVQFQLVSRQKFNLSKYNKAYNAAFAGGAFLPATGPPQDYNTPNTDLALGGNPAITPFLQGPVKPALPNEMGWKDTYVVYPGEVTTFAIRFTPTDEPAVNPGPFKFDPKLGPGYVWHCHIIDHEDNEMMRPMAIRPAGFVPTPAPMAMAKGASAEGDITEQLIDKINEVVLEQNIPNPFSAETQIRFMLPESAHVQLTLINSLGQVTTLIDAEAPAGLNTAMIDAGSLKGGIYFYQLRTANVTLVKKMVVLK